MSHSRALLILLAATGFLAGTTCEVDDPCDRYVDYVCECHADDAEFDCEELRIILDDAEPSVQDQCAVDLDELEAEDEAEGTGCETDTEG